MVYTNFDLPLGAEMRQRMMALTDRTSRRQTDGIVVAQLLCSLGLDHASFYR
jgi:hypothetical protein